MPTCHDQVVSDLVREQERQIGGRVERMRPHLEVLYGSTGMSVVGAICLPIIEAAWSMNTAIRIRVDEDLDAGMKDLDLARGTEKGGRNFAPSQTISWQYLHVTIRHTYYIHSTCLAYCVPISLLFPLVTHRCMACRTLVTCSFRWVVHRNDKSTGGSRSWASINTVPRTSSIHRMSRCLSSTL